MEGRTRKLKMICLHGSDCTKEVMEYQSRKFREVFKNVCEFLYIESPLISTNKPDEAIVKKGFKGPFK